MNETGADWLATDDWEEEDWSRTPFDSCWYKALMITLYSVVCVGCIVGKYQSQFSAVLKCAERSSCFYFCENDMRVGVENCAGIFDYIFNMHKAEK